MFINKKDVIDLKVGDRIIYPSGAKRVLSAVIFRDQACAVTEQFDKSVETEQIRAGIVRSFEIQNGKIILKDGAIGIEREE